MGHGFRLGRFELSVPAIDTVPWYATVVMSVKIMVLAKVRCDTVMVRLVHGSPSHSNTNSTALAPLPIVLATLTSTC